MFCLCFFFLFYRSVAYDSEFAFMKVFLCVNMLVSASAYFLILFFDSSFYVCSFCPILACFNFMLLLLLCRYFLS